jgi:pimeloyl-ACP methyl ester carboxylesterase
MANTHPIRDLGYLAWSNDLAWMEGQSGKRWDVAVKSENQRFARALAPLKNRVREFQRDLEAASESEKGKAWKWSGWAVKKAEYSPVETWCMPHTSFSVDAWDADAAGDHFAAAVAVEGGYERFNLQIYSVDKKNKTKAKPELINTIERVGPYAAFLNKKTLIYLGSEADHRYNSVHAYDVRSGKTTTLFELSDSPKTHNLELRRVEDGSVSVIESDFVDERLGIISESGINWVTEASKIIVLAHDTWIKDGKTSLGLPSPFTDYLEAISLKGGWAVTLSHGIRTLWKLGSNGVNPRSMVYIWGEIHYDVREPTRLSVSDMRYEPYTIETGGKDWKLSNTLPYPFVSAYYNTVAPTFVVTSQIFGEKPKGLLVTAYGAYGFPTKIGRLVQRWSPLLKAGWAIASVAVPGSGDHNLAWRFQGQATGRKIAVDTLCYTVKDLQEELGIEPAKTALYGRSAGGLLVAAVLNESPGLVGALYMESPYVDAMRTMTNPKFPLTVLESKEFGAGTNPTDVISLGAWSPMERIPSEGYPGVFMVARTDMADLEVYPYEVLKYITRARGEGAKGQPKLLSITTDKGHFTTDQETRAEDLALLDKYIGSNKNLSNKYKMNAVTMPPMMRKNRSNGMTRKNRDRKDKNRANKNRSNKNRSNKNRSNKNRSNKNRKNKNRTNRNRKNRN